MFTREHQSVVRKGKHRLLPNSQCPVTSKIEHVIGLGALTFPASWKEGLYDLLRRNCFPRVFKNSSQHWAVATPLFNFV